MSCLGPCAVYSFTARRPRAGWGAIHWGGVGDPCVCVSLLGSSPQFHRASRTWLFLTPFSGERRAKSARRVRTSSSQYQHYLRQVPATVPDGSADASNEQTPPPNTPNRRFRRAPRGLLGWQLLQTTLALRVGRDPTFESGRHAASGGKSRRFLLLAQRRARAPITPVADCASGPCSSSACPRVDVIHDLQEQRAPAGLPHPPARHEREGQDGACFEGRLGVVAVRVVVGQSPRAARVGLACSRSTTYLPACLPPAGRPVVAAVEDFLEKGWSAQKRSVVTYST